MKEVINTSFLLNNKKAVTFILTAFFWMLCTSIYGKSSKSEVVILLSESKGNYHYNLRNDIFEYFKNKLDSDKLIVFDGPLKKRKLQKEEVNSLKYLIHQGNVGYDILFYEDWISTKNNKFKSILKGIAINYEYYQDSQLVKSSLFFDAKAKDFKSNVVHVDRCGYANNKLFDVINGHIYEYDVAVFNNKLIEDYNISVKIKKEHPFFIPRLTQKIKFIVLQSDILATSKSVNNKKIIQGLEAYFSIPKNTLTYPLLKDANKLKIKNFKVGFDYVYNESGQLTDSVFKQFYIEFFGYRQDLKTKEEVLNNVKVEGKSLLELIKQQDFGFTIIQVNDDLINENNPKISLPSILKDCK